MESEYRNISSNSQDSEEDSYDKQEREKEERFNIVYEEAIIAIDENNIDKLDMLMNSLFELYDWEDANYDDYSFDLLRYAVEKNNSNIIIYLLERKENWGGDDITGEEMSQNEHIKTIIITACSTQNIDIIKFALDFVEKRETHKEEYTMYSEEFFAALKSGNEEIALLILENKRLCLLYFYYDNWNNGSCSVKESINLAMKISQKAVNTVLDLLHEHESKYYQDALDLCNREDV